MSIHVNKFWEAAGLKGNVSCGGIRKVVINKLYKANSTSANRAEEADYFNHSLRVHEHSYVLDDKIATSARVANRIEKEVWQVITERGI